MSSSKKYEPDFAHPIKTYIVMFNPNVQVDNKLEKAKEAVITAEQTKKVKHKIKKKK